MAQEIMLKHKETGVIKRGYYGFSWTTLFFGFFPSLFRMDFFTFIGGFIILILVGIITYGIGSAVAMVLWAFFYNKYYTSKLLEKGYVFSDSPERVAKACTALGVSPPALPVPTADVPSIN